MSDAAPLPAVAPAPAPAPADRPAELRQAAEAFEGLFLQMLIRQMRDSQLEEGFFGGGTGSPIYEGVFEQHLADALSRKSPLGIAEMLLEQWGVEGATDASEQVRKLRARQAYDLLMDPSGVGSRPAQVPPVPADTQNESGDPEADAPAPTTGEKG